MTYFIFYSSADPVNIERGDLIQYQHPSSFDTFNLILGLEVFAPPTHHSLLFYVLSVWYLPSATKRTPCTASPSETASTTNNKIALCVASFLASASCAPMPYFPQLYCTSSGMKCGGAPYIAPIIPPHSLLHCVMVPNIGRRNNQRLCWIHLMENVS